MTRPQSYKSNPTQIETPHLLLIYQTDHNIRLRSLEAPTLAFQLEGNRKISK